MFRGDRFAGLRGLAVLPAVALLLALLAAACDGGGGVTPEAELEALAGRASAGVAGKVTYRVSSKVDGEVVEEGKWVLAQRPPDYRFDIVGTEGGEEFRTIMISTGGNSYLCTSGGGQESCLATGPAAAETEGALFDPLFSIPREIAEGGTDVELLERSERQIAGVDATCFTVSSTLTDLGEGAMCFSNEGLLLLLERESITFEATDVSTEVTDADFERPYEIMAPPGS